MKRQNNRMRANAIVWICVGALVCGHSSFAASLPADWQHEQPFNVPAPGLVKTGSAG